MTRTIRPETGILDALGVAGFGEPKLGPAGVVQSAEDADNRDASGARVDMHDISQNVADFVPVSVPGLPSTGQNGQPTRNAATVQDVADRATQSAYGDDDA
jgi:hypothetical protein